MQDIYCSSQYEKRQYIKRFKKLKIITINYDEHHIDMVGFNIKELIGNYNIIYWRWLLKSLTLGKWKGCYLGYPQYGVSVNVEEGDFLIMNPYEYHCNTEFKGKNDDRMSIVTYSRSGIIN